MVEKLGNRYLMYVQFIQQKFNAIGISQEKKDSWGKEKNKDNRSGRLGLMSISPAANLRAITNIYTC